MPTTPHPKSTTFSSDIQSITASGNKLFEELSRSLNVFMSARVLRSLKGLKRTGYPVSELITTLFMLPYLGYLCVHALCTNTACLLNIPGKDAFYQVLNEPRLDWRSILYVFTKFFRTKVQEKGSNPQQAIRAYILDDTTIEKTGAHIQGISFVHDHNLHKSVLGFKTLVLAFFDGISTIALDFSLHREDLKKPNARQAKLLAHCPKPIKSKAGEPALKSDKRKDELNQEKPRTAIEMLKRAFKNGFKAQYVLMDSWFMSEYIIQQIRSIEKGAVHVLGMVKQDARKYSYQNIEASAKELIAKYARNAKTNRKYNLKYIALDCTYKGYKVRLFLVKTPRTKDFKLLLTTDTKLSVQQVFEIYQIRWSIEVLFRDCKQILHLGKCQSNSFDAQIASLTLSLMRHTALTLTLRFTNYETLGELFRETSGQLKRQTNYDTFKKVLQILLVNLSEVLALEWELVMRAITQGNEQVWRIIEAIGFDKTEEVLIE